MAFWRDEQAQDIGEYALLLALILLVSACLFIANSSSMGTVWQTANDVISQGAQDAKGVKGAHKLGSSAFAGR